MEVESAEEVYVSWPAVEEASEGEKDCDAKEGAARRGDLRELTPGDSGVFAAGSSSLSTAMIPPAEASSSLRSTSDDVTAFLSLPWSSPSDDPPPLGYASFPPAPNENIGGNLSIDARPDRKLSELVSSPELLCDGVMLACGVALPL